MLEGTEYEKYTRTQARKLNKHRGFIEGFQEKFRKSLAERLSPYSEWLEGKSVLCLAARLGTEVEVFWGYGCFAIGIDLNPGGASTSVVEGDFHKVQYPDDSVDLVYTNSYDHSLYPDKLLTEVRRVLKPNGRFVLEASRGTKEGYKFDGYDINRWERTSDVAKQVREAGFELISKKPFRIPWPGVHYLWHC